MQSNITTITEDLSMMDLPSVGNDSLLTAEAGTAMALVASKVGKKGCKAKKEKTAPRAKTSKQDSKIVLQDRNTIEAEDDNFDVKTHVVVPKKSKKRNSDEMTATDEPADTIEPPTKRRITRTRSAIIRLQTTINQITVERHDEDVPMDTDASVLRGNEGRQSKKRGSLAVRKASLMSTTSESSLRTVLSRDDEIDAALEADLERSSISDKMEIEPCLDEKPKTRQPTRTRVSKKATASTASIQRTTRARTISSNDVEVLIPSTSASTTVQLGNNMESKMKVASTVKQPSGGIEVQVPAIKSRKVRERSPPSQIISRVPKEQQDTPRVSSIAAKAEESVSSPAVAFPAPEKSHHEQRSLNILQSAEQLLNEETDPKATKQSKQPRGKERISVGKKARSSQTPSQKNEDIMHHSPQKMQSDGENAKKDIPTAEKHSDVNIYIDDAKTPPAQKEEFQKAKEMSTEAEEKKRPLAAALRNKTRSSKEASIDSTTAIHHPNVSDQLPLVTSRKSAVAHSSPSQAVTKNGLSSPTPSPQSSDAENQPPSCRPSQHRPPLTNLTPIKSRLQSPTKTNRVPLAASTPNVSTPRLNAANGLQTICPWTRIGFEELIFGDSDHEKSGARGGMLLLDSPQKQMTVEEWIYWNAREGEERLRAECERLVGQFEAQGVKALRALEGIVVSG